MHFFSTLMRRSKVYINEVNLGKSLLVSFGIIITLIVLHIGLMMKFEGLSAFDSLWLTMTTIFTVGYGDLAAKTEMGRMSTMLVLYVMGVFMVAHAASEYFEYRLEGRQKKVLGKWRWKMENHLVILGIRVLRLMSSFHAAPHLTKPR